MGQELDYSHIYRKWHSDNPDHMMKMKRYFHRMLGPFLPANKDVRVLEIGCGMGFALMLFQELGYSQVLGIDTDKTQIQTCIKKKLNVAHTPDSKVFLDQHTGSFDLILALDLIEHIPHEHQLDYVQSIYRSLRKGGILICTVPNANSPLAARMRYICWTHHISFTEHSLDFLLHHGGFSQISVMEAGSFMRPRIPWLIRPSVLRWWLLLMVRGFHRLEMIAEFGIKEGKEIPLSLNLLARAEKKSDE